MSHDVFVSYASQDKTFADGVCAVLESNQVRCWIAPRDVLPGVPYAEALIDAIAESRIVVLVFSSKSNNSHQVLREIERAVSKGLPILPFRIEDVPLSKSMEYYISTPHWLDAMTPPLQQHLGRLAETVRLLLARTASKGDATLSAFGATHVATSALAASIERQEEERDRWPLARPQPVARGDVPTPPWRRAAWPTSGRYGRQVCRATPGCVLLLVDQSGSMAEPVSDSDVSKSDAVATAVNVFLHDLISRCDRGEERPRNLFQVGLVGSTTDQTGTPCVRSLWQGDLAGKDLVDIDELSDHPLKIITIKKKDGSNGLVDAKLPVWYKPVARGGSPTCAALETSVQWMTSWCAEHPSSFPPLVIQVVDGSGTDGDPEPVATTLRSITTEQGAVLLGQCHITASRTHGVLFPVSEQSLRDPFARSLFRMASVIPEELLPVLHARDASLPNGARLIAFDAGRTMLRSFFLACLTLVVGEEAE